MPYCPQCKNEFIEGTTVCEDCGLSLVAELYRGTPKPEDVVELVEVWRTQGEVEAQLIKSLLEGNGIESMLSGESLRLTHGFTVDGLALVKILVRPGDARRSCDIISSREGMSRCASCEFPVLETDAVCWNCGTKTESR
jgi:predicted amidophosphoribosyltransferase